jgi:hypothetical protein
MRERRPDTRDRLSLGPDITLLRRLRWQTDERDVFHT